MSKTYGRDVFIDSWKIYLGVLVAVLIGAFLVWTFYLVPQGAASPLSTSDLPKGMIQKPEEGMRPTGNQFKPPKGSGAKPKSQAKASKMPGRK